MYDQDYIDDPEYGMVPDVSPSPAAIKGQMQQLANGKGYKSNAYNLQMILEGDGALDGLSLDTLSMSLTWRRFSPGDKIARPWTDSDATRLGIHCSDVYGIDFSEPIINSVARLVAEGRAFNPLQEHLRALVRVAGVSIDTWLIRYCGCADTPYVRMAGRLWLLQLVTRALSPGCQAHLVLMLLGSQGLGKSTILRILGGEWFRDDLPEITTKDAVQYLNGAWLVEIAEMEALHYAEQTKVKAFITTAADTYRPAYARTPITVPRSCVFAATSNADEPLKDATGSRRFLPVTVGEAGKLDLDGLARDRDALLAEAVHIITAGGQQARHWMTPDDQKLAEVAAKPFNVSDAWETKIASWSQGKNDFKTADVFEQCLDLNVTYQDRRASNRVSQVLKKLDFEQKSKRNPQGEPKFLKVWKREQ